MIFITTQTTHDLTGKLKGFHGGIIWKQLILDTWSLENINHVDFCITKEISKAAKFPQGNTRLPYMYTFKVRYVSQATYSIAQLGEWPTSGVHNNLMKCALHHMVYWYSAKFTRVARTASWNHADIQDLAQYYCFANIRVKWNKTLTPMPNWVAKHFWKLSNNYISNLIPMRFCRNTTYWIFKIWERRHSITPALWRASRFWYTDVWPIRRP